MPTGDYPHNIYCCEDVSRRQGVRRFSTMYPCLREIPNNLPGKLTSLHGAGVSKKSASLLSAAFAIGFAEGVGVAGGAVQSVAGRTWATPHRTSLSPSPSQTSFIVTRRTPAEAGGAPLCATYADSFNASLTLTTTRFWRPARGDRGCHRSQGSAAVSSSCTSPTPTQLAWLLL